MRLLVVVIVLLLSSCDCVDAGGVHAEAPPVERKAHYILYTEFGEFKLESFTEEFHNGAIVVRGTFPDGSHMRGTNPYVIRGINTQE